MFGLLADLLIVGLLIYILFTSPKTFKRSFVAKLMYVFLLIYCVVILLNTLPQTKDSVALRIVNLICLIIAVVFALKSSKKQEESKK